MSVHPCSKNQCGMGVASVISNLAYSPAIEELTITAISLTHSPHSSTLADALKKLFSLTISLKKVLIAQ